METPRRVLRKLHLDNLQKTCTPLKIPASPFMKTLGYGTGVNVYRLELSPKCGQIRSPLAVKRVTRRYNQNKDLFNKRIQEEAEVLRKLSHPNIVGYRGLERAEDGVNVLALEYCTNCLGNILEDALDQGKGPLQPKLTMRMIKDIANALDYLHTDFKLLHGDLKSYNVLVKGDFEICKLCDFGVSLPLDDDGSIDFRKNPHLRYVGTNIWSAPEIMDESPVIDCKADIFSFGLVIYETIALVPPHTLRIEADNISAVLSSDSDTDPERTAFADEVSIEKENINDSLHNGDEEDDNHDGNVDEDEEECNQELERIDRLCGTRPPLPEAFVLNEEYNQIVEIFYICTNELSENRPTAKTIVQQILLVGK